MRALFYFGLFFSTLAFTLTDIFFHSGVTQDMVEAVRWYRASASQHHVQAQTALALCYELGKGVETDIDQAVHWFVLVGFA